MMPLPDVLPIKPFTRPARGEVTLPGSKSITNRALLLAALCDGPVTLTGALFSEDTEIMAESLRRLGFAVKEDKSAQTISVVGRGGKIPNEKAELFVGNAGTAARFLTALCAAAPRGTYQLDGVPQMRKRPMKGLLQALEDQGAKIAYHGEKYFFPFTLEAHGLKGGEVKIDASESSQMLSAFLMVARPSPRQIDVSLVGKVRWPFVEMTANLMKAFGQPPIARPARDPFPVSSGRPYSFPGKIYAIEPDATAASYFLALPIVAKGRLELSGLKNLSGSNRLQGDAEFADVLGDATTGVGRGIEIECNDSGTGVSADKAFLRGGTWDFNEFSDTFLTLAAISPLLEGKTTITGIAHTRKQETDRLAGAAEELRRLGQNIDPDDEKKDILTITPNLAELKKRAAQGPIEIETYNDHRFAMSFAILGCHDLLGNGQPWLAIKNPACCAKTFPNFFDVLEQVWKNSHQ